MRYRLRTLLLVLALGPILLASTWFGLMAYRDFRSGLHDQIRLQYRGWEDEVRRSQKGLPTFSQP